MDTIDRQYPLSAEAQGSPAADVKKGIRLGTPPAAQAAFPVARRPVALRWLLHDIPYIAMLLLALVGVVLRLPVIYWVILTPVFGIISVAEGWNAGVQARVWQICAVGGVLFLAVPGLGWLDQSPLLLTAGTCLIIALGGVGWWVSQWHQGTTGQTAAPSPSR